MNVLAMLLFVLGVVALGVALVLRRQSGIPWARVTYDDAGCRAVEQPLRSLRYGLVGRPDYLIERYGELIPVEVKPGRRAAEPYYGDMMQLAAYCLLVEEISGRAPRYGLLRYAAMTFQIPYGPYLRAEVLEVLDRMRADLESDECDRDHDQPARCRGCGFFPVCEQALE